MKNGLILVVLASMLLLAACTTVEKDFAKETESKFYVNIPMIDGYYNGEKVWFIHPDVSSAEMSEKLTRMINYKTLYVPQHNNAVDTEKLAKLYVFKNGVDHRGVGPWGGGPFGYQIDIFDSIPGQEGYTSLRMPYTVTWNENAKPRILTSEKDLLESKDLGELVVEPTGIVVNVPMIRWPGGSTTTKSK